MWLIVCQIRSQSRLPGRTPGHLCMWSSPIVSVKWSIVLALLVGHCTMIIEIINMSVSLILIAQHRYFNCMVLMILEAVTLVLPCHFKVALNTREKN